jgi:hypothetical protein
MTAEEEKTHQVSVHIGDFNAMRAEIELYSTKQSYYLLASFGITGYAFKYALDPHPRSVAFAAFSTALSLLWFFYDDMDRAVYRCAKYTVDYIRPKLQLLVGTKDIIPWEIYIRTQDWKGLKPFAKIQQAWLALFVCIPALLCSLLTLLPDSLSSPLSFQTAGVRLDNVLKSISPPRIVCFLVAFAALLAAAWDYLKLHQEHERLESDVQQKWEKEGKNEDNDQGPSNSLIETV